MTGCVKRTRPRGFATWQPQAQSRALVESIQEVIGEYRHHLPLTCRQIFYRLVAKGAVAKDEKAYGRLCEAINRARRAGLIQFSAIRDDGASRYEKTAWRDRGEFLDAFKASAGRFQLDRQSGQPVRLWLLCEAAGMAPMLARVANPLGVPVLTSGGFDSLTAKHDLAEEIDAQTADGAGAEVLHVGDHDPSGVHLFYALGEDVGDMASALAGVDTTFTRLAVTAEQAEQLELPTAPPKPSDKRQFSGATVQAEAIPPDTLGEIVRDAIQARQDEETRESVLAEEASIRDGVLRQLEGVA